MEDPYASIVEKCEYSSSQEELLRCSFFARAEEFYSDDDSGSPVPDGAFVDDAGIVICSALDTQNGGASQNEVFKTPPEESRRSNSCDGQQEFVFATGAPKLGGSISRGKTKKEYSAGVNSVPVNLKHMPAESSKGNLGFSKAIIGEMMKISSDGKVKVRDAPKAGLERFDTRDGEMYSKEGSVLLPSKKRRASAENNLFSSSPIKPELQKDERVFASSNDVPKKVRSNQPLTAGQDGSPDKEGLTELPPKKGKASAETNLFSRSPKRMVLPKDDTVILLGDCLHHGKVHCTQPRQIDKLEACKEAMSGGNMAEEKSAKQSKLINVEDTQKVNYESETQRLDEEDGRNCLENINLFDANQTRSKGKGIAVAEGRRKLPPSILRSAESKPMLDNDTILRNLMGLLKAESGQVKQTGDEGGSKQKTSDSNGKMKAVDRDSIARKEDKEREKENLMKRLVDVLGSLRRDVQRLYPREEEVDLVEIAKRGGMTFPRPRWWAA